MKHSIRVRLILTLALLMVFTIFLCWFMNKAFLPSYYEANKMKTLDSVYTKVNEAYNRFDDKSNEAEKADILLALDLLGANKNMNIYVFNLYKNGFVIWPEYQYPLNLSVEQYEVINSRIKEFIISSNEGNQSQRRRERLKTEEGYTIYKVYDEVLSSYYLELFGSSDDESWIYISTNYQSMLESVTISNQFLGYVGMGVVILGIIIMYFISRSFTKPILELSEIARKMSRLDFDAKYSVKGQDEISVLGNSINLLSEKLKDAISDLKSANNELQTDIENKIQIDEMRKEFLSNVSHELKTPIALIQGYAEGLKENINDDAENREFYCEVIMDEANKMNLMVKKLLSLNQIEFGNNQIAFERFDIVSLIKTILSSSEILFQQKEITVEYPTYSPVYVWAEEYLIEEVITNYISNAIHHVDDSKIIRITLVNRGDVIRVSVFNTGERILKEDMEKIWIKFYKVDKARSREYGGSGIGLSIVKAIMTSINRDCGVINHEDGVEFWFELDITNDEIKEE